MSCHFQPLGASRPVIHACHLLGIPGFLTYLLARPDQNVMIVAAEVLTLYLSILSVSIVAYRLSPFHPLARYPGPILCKISMFWLAKVAWRGKEHIYHQELHERYGEIIRIGMR